jgi:YaiO family outer membrane protein
MHHLIFKNKLFKSSFLFIALLFSQSLFAQSELSPDSLFQQARMAAFDKKDYSLAAELSKKALIISPEYIDILIFLGRIYTWWNKTDSARACFNEVLSKHPDNEDASAAYADLEYWSKNPTKALSICEEGLAFHPHSKILMLKKAKSLIDLKRLKEANDVLVELLKNDPQNTEVHALSEKIKEGVAKNTIGVTYDFVSFDKQFPNPWHMVGLEYLRSTAIGSFIGRLNYANRFKTNAVQFEADAYPKISKTFYGYMNAGISNKKGVFPQYRAGFSLYANLPESFEAEAGFRYLYFNDATWIYTGSLGKYLKNYWFNFKTYITPANQSVFNSYILTARYYYKGTNYFGLGLGTGISPDERSNNVQLANSYQLKSYRISADYRNTFCRSNILLVRFSWLSQQYLPKETGNQYVFSLGYQRVF